MPEGLEGIENFGTVIKIAGADLFFAFAAKGHGTEDDWELGFGRHCDVCLLAVVFLSARIKVALILYEKIHRLGIYIHQLSEGRNGYQTGLRR